MSIRRISNFLKLIKENRIPVAIVVKDVTPYHLNGGLPTDRGPYKGPISELVEVAEDYFIITDLVSSDWLRLIPIFNITDILVGKDIVRYYINKLLTKE